MKGKIISVNISEKKGERKTPVHEAVINENYGIVGDAHSSPEWHRQVSLLAIESIDKMRAKGLDVNPGDFAENITTGGIDLLALPIGTKLEIGKEVIGEVSQIGKECHTRCQIYYQAGDCVMPKEGIFIRVLRGGTVKVGDAINVICDVERQTGMFTIAIAVLTLSDKGSKGERTDESGPAIAEALKELGEVTFYDILPDERDLIRERLLHYAGKVDLILTTGGTGLSPRDVTPEATRDVIEREVPGIAEAMRTEGLKKTRNAMLSRAIAGVKGQTLIINLPGSPKAVRENLAVIIDVLPHAIQKIKGDPGDCAR